MARIKVINRSPSKDQVIKFHRVSMNGTIETKGDSFGAYFNIDEARGTAATRLGRVRRGGVTYVNAEGEEVFIETGPVVNIQTVDPTLNWLPDGSLSEEDAIAYGQLVATRTALTVWGGITLVEDNTFSDWSGLRDVKIYSGNVGKSAFATCQLDSLYIGSGVERIGDLAFAGNQRICNLTFEEGIRSIGAQAFAGWISSKRIVLPMSLTELGNQAFTAWNYVEYIFTGGLEMIGDANGADQPFMGAGNQADKTEIVLGPNTREVGVRAFADFKTGVKLTLNEGLETIYESAFENFGQNVAQMVESPAEDGMMDAQLTFNNNLTTDKLYVPVSVTSIGNRAFSNSCFSKLLLPGNDQLTFGENCFRQCRAEEIVFGIAKGLSSGAFGDMLMLSKLDFGQGFETMEGEVAFLGAYKITELNIPSRTRVISNGVFTEMIRVKQINFSEGLETIGSTTSPDGLFGRGGRTSLVGIIYPRSLKNFYGESLPSSQQFRWMVFGDQLEVFKEPTVNGGDFDTIYMLGKPKAGFDIPARNGHPRITLRTPEIKAWADAAIAAGFPEAVEVLGYCDKPPTNTKPSYQPLEPFAAEEHPNWNFQYRDLTTGEMVVVTTGKDSIDAEDITATYYDDVLVNGNVVTIKPGAFGDSSIKRFKALSGVVNVGAPIGVARLRSLDLPFTVRRVGVSLIAGASQEILLLPTLNYLSIVGSQFASYVGKFDVPVMTVLPPEATNVTTTSELITGDVDVSIIEVRTYREDGIYLSTGIPVDGKFSVGHGGYVENGDTFTIEVIDMVGNRTTTTHTAVY